MNKVALSLVCVLSALAPASAQQHPNRAVEIIVPFAAGGAPAKTPADIMATLNRNTVETLQESAVRARISEQGAEVVANSPDEFRAFIRNEMDRLGAVIKSSNIQLD
jgi:tripartite-type tricarboxylate transporter receptor subunit TctC